jgi:hypothetical protein
MDSVVIGLALERAGLPPVTYGAGKNLFTNPFISFFMHNLGAYRVDRRLRFELYKEILKEYSTVLLESGYHSLFFPGGTRCRSNIIEKNLKLGLLGTTVTAYKNSVRDGAPHKRLYIVPATINYRLVLEAETLIDDYLAETGKNRYIITDDEFSRVGRLVEFFRKILAHEGSVQHIDGLTDDEKSVFRTAFEIDQRWVIELAADRSPLICQGQSLNLYLRSDIHKWDLLMLHWTAWERGVKSLYYCRSKSVQRAGFAGVEADNTRKLPVKPLNERVSATVEKLQAAR